MKRAITLFLLIFVNFILQSTLFGFHDMSHVTPNLLLILVMSFGLMRGRKEGMLVGFFSGFFVDAVFNSVFGPFMFLYMIIGYINGFLHKNYVVEDVLLPLVIIVFDEFLFNTGVYVGSFLLRNHLNFKDYLFDIILPETLYTALLTVIIYKLLVFINRRLKDEDY